MPYVNNNGIRIHFEIEGSGPPLVLQHGSLGRGEDWKSFGYVEILKRNSQLILIDARGHGASDKPHDPAAYDAALRVSDVTAVLDELYISRTDYFGYSMGGWIGFALAKYAPERCRALIMGGAHPYFENMQPFRDIMPQEPAAFAAMMDKVFGVYMTPEIRAGLISNDLKAVSAFMQDRAPFPDVLQTMRMPCLLLVGEHDPRLPQVRECCAVLANATFAPLPGCDHVAGFARSDLVLPHVTSFLASVRQTTAA
jgi:pimeloyl-ACP methyl ester carboxylesterase